MDNDTLMQHAQISELNVEDYQPSTQDGVLAKLRGRFSTSKEASRNNRNYTPELLKNITSLDTVKEMIATKTFFGELSHPPRDVQYLTEVQITNASHNITSLEYDDNSGELIGQLDILDTPSGRIANTLLKYGSKLGISSRGAMLDNGGGYQDDSVMTKFNYMFITFDLVALPGIKGARLDPVFESMSPHASWESKSSLIKAIDEALSSDDKDSLLILESMAKSAELSKQLVRITEALHDKSFSDNKDESDDRKTSDTNPDDKEVPTELAGSQTPSDDEEELDADGSEATEDKDPSELTEDELDEEIEGSNEQYSTNMVGDQVTLDPDTMTDASEEDDVNEHGETSGGTQVSNVGLNSIDGVDLVGVVTPTCDCKSTKRRKHHRATLESDENDTVDNNINKEEGIEKSLKSVSEDDKEVELPEGKADDLVKLYGEGDPNKSVKVDKLAVAIDDENTERAYDNLKDIIHNAESDLLDIEDTDYTEDEDLVSIRHAVDKLKTDREGVISTLESQLSDAKLRERSLQDTVLVLESTNSRIKSELRSINETTTNSIQDLTEANSRLRDESRRLRDQKYQSANESMTLKTHHSRALLENQQLTTVNETLTARNEVLSREVLELRKSINESSGLELPSPRDAKIQALKEALDGSKTKGVTLRSANESRSLLYNDEDTESSDDNTILSESQQSDLKRMVSSKVTKVTI